MQRLPHTAAHHLPYIYLSTYDLVYLSFRSKKRTGRCRGEKGDRGCLPRERPRRRVTAPGPSPASPAFPLPRPCTDLRPAQGDHWAWAGQRRSPAGQGRGQVCS